MLTRKEVVDTRPDALLGNPYLSGMYEQHPSLTKSAHPWRTMSPHRNVIMRKYQA
jgi:hypothetical protein